MFSGSFSVQVPPPWYPASQILVVSKALNSSLCFLNMKTLLFTVWTQLPCGTVEKVLSSRNLGKWKDHLVCSPPFKHHSPELSICPTAAQMLYSFCLILSFFMVWEQIQCPLLSWLNLEFPSVIHLRFSDTHLIN